MKIKMIKLIIPLSCLVLLAFSSAQGQHNSDQLYDSFVNPPPQARPFTRWWWNGDCVEEHEIKRELDIMKKAGLGGVEINPIQMPLQQAAQGIKPLKWLSPEWNRAVKLTSEWAKKNSMLTDLIVGSGWPFGGEFLKPGETGQRILLKHMNVTGPSVFIADVEEILNQVPKGYDSAEFKNALKSRILFMKLVPEKLKSIDQCRDLISSIGKDGSIRIKVPPGRYKIFIGIWQEGYSRVTYGAPGSDGPVLDHLNAFALKKYLDRMADSLEKDFGSELGDYLRSLFCDSIELDGANWTTDFLEEFQKICGYNLEPYLPFVFYEPYRGYKDELAMTENMKDSLRKIRYDYNKVLVKLFLDRFTTTFKNWCNEHGTLARYQAYGLPWLVGISEGYLIPDIPESNNWLFHDVKSQGSVMWNKYASSSGHIKGRSDISCEAMTNLNGVFKTSLEYIKQADDMNFITGITHSVLHGYNYSPPSAGFPGWLRFGTYFNEQNTWWPYFRLWTDYNARLSSVFQSSKPLAEVAILGPTADVWSDHGLYRNYFNNTPWYVYSLWESFSQNGITADYINESLLQNAAFDKGSLVLGQMKYKLLILTDVESISPETAKRMIDYVKAGGKIVFTDRIPSRSPSLLNAARQDRQVQMLMKNIVQKNPGHVYLVKSPQHENDLVSWTKEVVMKVGLEPAVTITEPSSRLYQVHYVHGNKAIFFFANQDYNNSAEFTASFANIKGYPWKWDPETGKKELFYYGNNPHRFNVKLKPLESLLLVFENEEGQQHMLPETVRSSFISTDPLWDIQFIPHIGKEFAIKSTGLPDIAASQDARLNSFAGVIKYNTTFVADTDKGMIMDLGKVYGVSEVYINGHYAGTRWYGDRQFPLKEWVKKGRNELTIKVTTTLHNYCRTQVTNPEIKRWLRTKDAEPSGMPGPVKIYF